VIVLPDTSIWVEYLKYGTRRPLGQTVDRLLGERAIVVCGPVLAELLTGMSPDARGELWHLLSVLPWARLDVAEWRLAGDVAATLRQKGETVPLTDIMIAVAAAAAGAAVWTQDTDFGRIARALPTLSLSEPVG
jgi:predicted nucleic acid-binding protein